MCARASETITHRLSGLTERCSARKAMLTRSATRTRACSASSPIRSTQPGDKQSLSTRYHISYNLATHLPQELCRPAKGGLATGANCVATRPQQDGVQQRNAHGPYGKRAECDPASPRVSEGVAVCPRRGTKPSQAEASAKAFSSSPRGRSQLNAPKIIVVLLGTNRKVTTSVSGSARCSPARIAALLPRATSQITMPAAIRSTKPMGQQEPMSNRHS
eukprot:2679093-Prymnesium_polylepis.4